MTTSNVDLDELARILGLNIQVVLQDDLQRLTPYEQQKLIINLGNLENGGTHWVALKIHGRVAMHFDSFGGPPTTAIKEYCKGYKLAHTNKIIQAIESNLCGWYCLAFFYYVKHSIKKNIIESTNDFTNLFSRNPDMNAGRLRGMLRAWLPEHRTPKRLYDLLFQRIKYK